MNKKIVVELIGMPGSGKSYYQKKIFNKYKQQAHKNNFTKFIKLIKFFFLICFFYKHPIFLIKSLYFLYRKKKTLDKKKHFYYFFNVAAYRGYFNSFFSKKKILINSEGFFYRSAYLFENNLTEALNKYFKYLPSVDVLILVIAKKNNILNRVKMRKKGFVYDKVDFKNYDKKEFFLKKIAKKHKNFTLVIENNISSNETLNLTKIFRMINKV